MSVTFSNRSVDVDFDDADTYLNLANSNAGDLLRWLGLPAYAQYGDLIGDLAAVELAARCRRRLWPEPRNLDPARPSVDLEQPGRAHFLECGRQAGYLRERTGQLLALCERDLASIIDWS